MWELQKCSFNTITTSCMWRCQTRNLLPLTSFQRTTGVSPSGVMEWNLKWGIYSPVCFSFFPFNFSFIFYGLYVAIVAFVAFLLFSAVLSFCGCFPQWTKRVRYLSCILFIDKIYKEHRPDIFLSFFYFYFSCISLKRLSAVRVNTHCFIKFQSV